MSLARAYEKGEGVTQNDELAAKWYRAAAEKGDPEAQNSLGVFYRLGRGVEEDKAKAVEWYRKAATQGYAAAMFNLAAAYYNGDGVGISDQYAYVWFFLGERAGSREAGDAVRRMETEVSASRLVDMKLFLADLARRGNGVPKNPSLAFQIVNSLPDNAAAQFEVGRMYAEGEGVAQNSVEALKHLEASNTVEAKLYLAEMYLDGRGVPRDVNKGIEWLHKAGVQNPTANVKIAGLYWIGESVPQDYKKALKYYEVAAGVGDPQALYMLGVASRDGLGTKKSSDQMCMFFVLAANTGSEQGKADTLHACTGPALDKAKKQSVQWLQKHPYARSAIRGGQAQVRTP